MTASVLVVEDDDDLREALCETLESVGYEVAGAAGGAEALAHLRSTAHPDLILLDLMMPGMNGWQFRVAQLADPELCAIPVVVVSASRSFEPISDLAVSDILAKPLKREQLIATIDRHLARRGGGGGAG